MLQSQIASDHVSLDNAFSLGIISLLGDNILILKASVQSIFPLGHEKEA